MTLWWREEEDQKAMQMGPWHVDPTKAVFETLLWADRKETLFKKVPSPPLLVPRLDVARFHRVRRC